MDFDIVFHSADLSLRLTEIEGLHTPAEESVPLLNINIDSVSIHDLRARLSRLAACDLTALSVSQVQQRLGLILDQIPVRFYQLGLNGLYRARENKDGLSFANARELWYPPAHLVGIGRLNDAEQSVFYAANTPHTAMFELRPQVGQRQTVLLSRTRDGLQTLDVAFLGITQSQSLDAAQAHLGSAAREAALRKELGPGNFKKHALVDKWLTEAITKVVPPSRLDWYKPTAALANLLFKAPIDGIAYPSVATAHQGINICLLPQRADELFLPDEAWEFEIDQVVHHQKTGKPLYRVKALRKSRSISNDRTINWEAHGVGVGSEFFTAFARDHLKSLSEWSGQ